MTVATALLGMSKLMHAMVYLDENQHRTLALDDYPACEVMLGLLPEKVAEAFQRDRAARWELPADAIEYLESTERQLANLRERGEHE